MKFAIHHDANFEDNVPAFVLVGIDDQGVQHAILGFQAQTTPGSFRVETYDDEGNIGFGLMVEAYAHPDLLGHAVSIPVPEEVNLVPIDL